MKICVAISVVCTLILVYLLWKTLNWVYIQPKRLERALKKQGLKGNPYKLVYGDTKEASRMHNEELKKPLPFTDNDYSSRIYPFLHQQFNKYGENCYTWLGPIPVINITEPALIREVFTRMNEFRKPKSNPLVKMLFRGLINYEGEKWTKHRKLMNPVFHMENLKLMLPAFGVSAIEMINKWDEIVSKTGFSEVNVWPYLSSLSADAISRAAFGSSYEEGRRVFELLEEQSQITFHLSQSVYIPGWRFVPTKINQRMKKINFDIQSSLSEIIDKRKKAMEAGEATNDYLLGILMDSVFKASTSSMSHNQQLVMSYQEMIDECKLFYLAGQETTSVLLVWTMILLSKHQDWQTRAREEVMAIYGKDEPNFDKLSHLKTVTMILYEVLRLYPPAPAIPRAIFDSETNLGSLSIPPGAMVNLSILHMHHDSRLWGDDAKEFKPERFSEGITKATKGNISFFPFGWGPRICIGQNFAIVEVKMALAKILQRFSFELSPSYTHAPTIVISLEPQHGAHVILRRLPE